MSSYFSDCLNDGEEMNPLVQGEERGSEDSNYGLSDQEEEIGFENEGRGEARGQQGVSLGEFLYASNAFFATLKPVSLSLILSTLAVIYVTSEFTENSDSGLEVYAIPSDDDGGLSDDDMTTTTDDGGQADDGGNQGHSDGEKLASGFINALIIVCLIGGLTFLIVLLYKYRCFKCLAAYMVFSAVVLLGFLGSLIFSTFLERFDLPFDMISFFFLMFNFATVGILAIFNPKGIPLAVSQGYMVCIAVIVSWNLSRLDEWAAWTLLIALALYDLCAVLSPCGPLKALVGLMEEYQEPLPALMYEARLPPPPASLRPPPRSKTSPRQEEEEEEEEVRFPGETSPYLYDTKRGDEGDRQEEEEEEEIEVGVGNEVSLEDVEMAAYDYEQFEATHAMMAEETRQLELQGWIQDEEYQQQQQQLHSLNGGGGFEEEERRRAAQEEEEEEEGSIKLGMGDFVFYSILVAKAAQYEFAACLSTFVVILGGLGLTMVLLSVFRKALPALPISIFLGVLFYLISRFLIIPLLETTSMRAFV